MFEKSANALKKLVPFDLLSLSSFLSKAASKLLDVLLLFPGSE